MSGTDVVTARIPAHTRGVLYGECRDIPVRVTLVWSCELAVEVVATIGGARWLMARDLLISGTATMVGQGDIRVRPLARGAVELLLRPPKGELAVILDAHELVGFLSRTTELVPIGAETFDFSGVESWQ